MLALDYPVLAFLFNKQRRFRHAHLFPGGTDVKTVEIVILNDFYKLVGIFRVGGIARFFKPASPAFIVGWSKFEKRLVAVAVAQEVRMVPEALGIACINPETLLGGIIIVIHLLAFPVAVALDAKMIMAFYGQFGEPVAAFQHALCESYAGRHAGAPHFLDRYAGVFGNVALLRSAVRSSRKQNCESGKYKR